MLNDLFQYTLVLSVVHVHMQFINLCGYAFSQSQRHLPVKTVCVVQRPWRARVQYIATAMVAKDVEEFLHHRSLVFIYVPGNPSLVQIVKVFSFTHGDVTLTDDASSLGWIHHTMLKDV
jgi:hypothetical protein